MDIKKIEQQARTMAARAKNGVATIGGKKYTLTFDPREWIYIVADHSGQQVTRFNTKRLGVAKQWLREWLA